MHSNRPIAASVLALVPLLLCAAHGQAQVDWVNVNSVVNPPRGVARLMTWDSVRQRVLLVTAGQTWEWDGLSWYQRTPPASPQAREGAGLAFDRARGRAVLFGGHDNVLNTYPGDTWEWDGTVWTRYTITPAPAPRWHLAMTWDPGAERVLVFGGENSSLSQRYRDTWAWNGTTWTQLSPANPPGSLQNACMVYDPMRGRPLLVGIGNGMENHEWDGQDWRALGRLGLQQAFENGLAYDPFRRTVLGFWGGSGLYAAELSGSLWRELAPRTTPPWGTRLAAATDESRGQVVVVAGDQFDTWLLVTDLRRVAPGHPAASLPLVAQTPPLLGQRMHVGFPSNAGFGLLLVGPGPCDTPLANVDAPLFCAAGTVYVQPWIPLVSTGNPAIVVLDLPVDPLFIGLRACLQGMALESGNCLRLTDAGETRLRLR